MKTVMKRETTATTVTETGKTASKKTRSSKKDNTHDYETPGVVFYLLSVQFISQKGGQRRRS